jgi:hypothetical protein
MRAPARSDGCPHMCLPTSSIWQLAHAPCLHWQENAALTYRGPLT